jgi:Putative bacterial sensory transduction regulator
MEVHPSRSAAETLVMGYVEPFSHAMIEVFLDDDGLNFLRDRDGDFIVQFGYDDEIQGHPRFLLAVSGNDQEQYCLRGDTYQRIPRAEWDRILRLCNEWNALYKMPKVYLEVDDPNTSTTGRVVCEQWIDLEAGVHQELVNQITGTFFSACFGFWRWLIRQNRLHTLGDPDEPCLPGLEHHDDGADEDVGPGPDTLEEADPIDDSDDLP